MKTSNNRLLRVGENIRSVLSKYLVSNEPYIEDLNNIIITVTEVQPTADLRYAKVYVSALGGNEKKIANILNEFASTFSRLVAREINTKYSPKLHFYPDLSFEKANKINKLIIDKNDT